VSAPPCPSGGLPNPSPTPPADRPATGRRAANAGQPEPPLRKIAEIELAGEKLDLARNGEHYHLVRAEQQDAYGRPVARKVPPHAFLVERAGNCDDEWSLRSDRAQALVDLIGELLTQIQGQKDLRLAAEHGAEP
jgi:hypothetical protein